MKNRVPLLFLLFWSSIGLGVWLILGDFLSLQLSPVVLWAFGVSLISFVIVSIATQGLMVFFVRRCFSSLITVFVIATLTFGLLRLLPGGPFDEEKALPSQVKKNIEKKYGLDQPLWKQYLQYMGNLTQGNLGYSYKYEGREVWEIIRAALPVSLRLGLYSLIVAFLLGIPLGLFAAAHHGTAWDTGAMFAVISGISLPSFLMAPIFIYVFSFGWPLDGIWPSLHQWMLDRDLFLPAALWNSPRHYILPVITLGIRPAAFIARLTRASVLDVIHSDFVRTARSKGLSDSMVLYRHVLRNSLIPVLTYAGPLVAGILSGSFVIEIIFAIPGIGKYFVQSVFNRDYPLIMALTLMFSMMLIFANLAVDILYKVVDPRMEVK